MQRIRVRRAKRSSFVPAESAELGITDKILVKMNTQESVSKASTWSTHGRNILMATDSEHLHERLARDISGPEACNQPQLVGD